MKKSKFNETQNVAILAQHENGRKVVDLCRGHGISQRPFYQRQRKYSGMEVNDLKKMKEMEAERVPFKRVAVDLTLQNRILKDAIEKK